MQAEINAFLDSLESETSYSHSTRMAYGTDLRLFFNHLKTSLQRTPTLADFNANHVSDFLEAERQEGMRLSTLLRRRATLHSFDRYLRLEGHTQDRALTPELQLIDKSEFVAIEQTKYLSPEDISKLWEVMSSTKRPLGIRDHAILAMLLETGLSVSGLVSVNLSDLDLAVGCFHFVSDTGQDYWLSLGRSREPLSNYIENARADLNPAPGEPALFISQNGIRMSRQSIWQVLHNAGKAAGLPFKLSPRMIRHTATINLVRSGKPLSEIQLFLGHTNPLSTHALLHRLATYQPPQNSSISKEL
jgi:site-specific recombinase XerD